MKGDETWTSELKPLDTERIVHVLAHHRVSYVIVGGIAAILHRWSGTTADIDIVPASSTSNLNRLGRCLTSLDARIWSDPSRSDLSSNGKPPEADDFGFTAEGLRRRRVWHLSTDAGLIDVIASVEGIGDHAELTKHAESFEVFGLSIEVASLGDIVASKRAAARPKDLRVLPELEALLREEKSQDG